MSIRAKLHPQERRATCAIAAIRTALHLQFDLRVSEEMLVVLTGRSRRQVNRNGTWLSDIRNVIRRANRVFLPECRWTCRITITPSLENLKRQLQKRQYPIVTVLNDGGELHCIVVLRVTSQRVVFFDPADGEAQVSWKSHQAFCEWWHGETIVIRRPRA